MARGETWSLLAVLVLATTTGCERRAGGVAVLPAPAGGDPEVTIDIEGEAVAQRPVAIDLGARPMDELDCESCHSAFQTFSTVHGAVDEDGCLGCHQSQAGLHPVPGAREFTLQGEGAELCGKCHDDEIRGEGRHEAVNEVGCLGCHRPHVSDGPGLLRRGSIRETCFSCHAPVAVDHPHAPVLRGECTECHDPHQSSYPALRVEPGSDLCVRCHEEFKGLLAQADLHQPVKEDCARCHAPHGGEIAKLLVAPVARLCGESGCHDAVLAAAGNPPRHPPVSECAQCHDPHGLQTRKLLRLEGVELCLPCHQDTPTLKLDEMYRHSAIGEAGCVGCHDPHGGAESLVRSSLPALCFSCHTELEQAVGAARSVHQPVREGGCSGCHDPHASERGRLLVASYPSKVKQRYRREDYDLCFRCHDPQMVEAVETDRATRFRDGRRNLHHVHVVEQSRTCRSCHEPHASESEHLVREELAFGESGWKMPIHYEADANGGACTASCHLERRYSR